MRHLVVLAVLLWAAGCAPYTLVTAQRVTVQRDLSVEPDIAWNRFRPAGTYDEGPVEVWTADGQILNTLTFFVGIEDRQPLLKRSSSEEQLPVFRKEMSPTEIMELTESTIVKQTKSAITSARNLRPAKIGASDGFRFEFSYVGKDEVDREGMAAGVVRNGKLYLILYQGTRLYHYGLRKPQVERLIESIRFADS